MDRHLRRVRGMAGTAELVEAMPELRHVRNATYAPVSAGLAWGLFDADRQIGATSAVVPGPSAPVETAPDAPYLYVGLMTHHYGHFITDVLCRLWPLLDWRGPRPRLLCHEPPGAAGTRPDFIFDMLAPLGFSPGDFVAFDRATRLPSVWVPAASLVHSARVYPVFGRLCRRIGREFWAGTTVDGDARPVFLSKTALETGIHKARGEEILVEELARRGVEIVSPEHLDFPAQVRLLAGRRTIMGTAASALHTTVFSAPRRRIVSLHWSNYLNANFAMLDRLNGNLARYYYPQVTELDRGSDFLLRWTIPEPRRVAEELLASAERFDELELRDAEDDARHAREFRRLRNRLARLGRRIGRRASRLAVRRRAGSPAD